MISRRDINMGLLAASATAILPDCAAARPVATAENVVLAHGLFADGSCWLDVIPQLQVAGLRVTSVQNPLTTLADSVAAVRRTLARQVGPTVLVGHSFAGTIVSEVGSAPSVSALVFVAGRTPDAGEDYNALAVQYPKPAASAGIMFDGDEGRLTEGAFLRDFAGDVPFSRARALHAVQQPFRRTLVTEMTTTAAWRFKPTFYSISLNDRTIDPGLQRFLAKRMNARTIELASSHLAMISHPHEVTSLILEAAGRGRR